MIDYDVHSWREHLFDIKGSMVREIIGRVSSCVAWSAFVVVCAKARVPVAIEPTVHSLVGVALGLLLVFRTNASYDRFWEGRRLWGGIVNATRDLGRGSRVYLKDGPVLQKAVVGWAVAFAYATMNSLRGKVGVGPVGDWLPKAEVEAACAAQHVPLDVAVRISNRLAEARDQGLISDYILVMLEQHVQRLTDYLGGCERISKTPLPFAYVVHLRRALIMYCFTLPFALVGSFGWLTILATFFVAYTFFGIEEIGVEIEDPFGHDDNDLPLERICATIEQNLLALVDGGRPE